MTKIVLGVLLALGSLFAAVDINNASVQELTTLKGIGEAKAKAIIAYRKKHCFKKAEDLMQVKGIGEATVKKNLKEIKVGKCKMKK
ncbi:ComEA family DNA-binding protein [Nitratifractor sp.]